MKSIHNRYFDYYCGYKDSKSQRQHGEETATEGIKKKRQGKQKSVPAVRAEKAHHNAGKGINHIGGDDSMRKIIFASIGMVG